MSRLEPRKILLPLIAPVVAVIVAFIITSLVLVAVGDPVLEVWQVIFQPPSSFGGTSMAKLVLPQADGKAAAT